MSSATLHIVRASAGSGKTYQLAANYIARAISGNDPKTDFRSILAVTFTNKATGEMKGRIISFLGELSNNTNKDFRELIAQLTGLSDSQIQIRSYQTLCGILTDYSAFSISTIDTFFQRIVRTFFFELGLDVRYEVVLERQGALLEAIDDIVQKSATDINLRKKITRLVDSYTEKEKNINFRKVFLSLFNDAASSGAISQNVADSTTLDNYFNSLATQASTARDRFVEVCCNATSLMDSHGISTADFKGISKSFVAYFYKVSTTRKIEKFSKAILKITATDATPTAEDYVKKKGANEATATSLFESLLNSARELMSLHLFIKTFDVISNTFARYALLSNLQQRITEIMSTRGELAIDTTPQLLEEITAGASVPFIFEKLGTRYTTIFIDEFQDTSHSQWQAFLPLLEEATSKAEEMAVMLIGDVKQAIYRWRGGDWSLLTSGVKTDMRGATIEDVTLNTSWRSEAEIVRFNNRVFNELKQSMLTKIIGDIGDSRNIEELKARLQMAYSNFQQEIAPPKALKNRGYVEATRYDKDATLQWVVDTIQKQLTYRKASQIAILVRGKRHGVLISNALEKAGIEFISDDVLTLKSSRVVLFVINTLRYMLHQDAITLACLNTFNSRPLRDELPENEQEFLESIKQLDLLYMMERIVEHYHLSGQDLYYLQSLYTIAHDYTRKHPTANVAQFLESWELKFSGSAVTLGQNDNAVRILTIHKSKGLEFDCVIVPFTAWTTSVDYSKENFIWVNEQSNSLMSHFGNYPIKYSKELLESAFSEEYCDEMVSLLIDSLNLLYVALTRAAQELYIGLSNSAEKSSNKIGYYLTQAILPKDSDIIQYGEPYEVEDFNEQVSCEASEEIVIDSLESYALPPFKTEDIL